MLHALALGVPAPQVPVGLAPEDYKLTPVGPSQPNILLLMPDQWRWCAAPAPCWWYVYWEQHATDTPLLGTFVVVSAPAPAPTPVLHARACARARAWH